MSEPKIQPHKVTKPIQLVAAWLAGLVLIDAMFLGAAASMNSQAWPHAALVVAAILNVPLFLGAIFLLQTKFRAELQEDSFYSEYLSKRTNQVVRVDKNAQQDARIETLETRLSQLTIPAPTTDIAFSEQPTAADWSEWLIAVNKLHPQESEIAEALEDAGIPVETFFGLGAEAEPPPRWVISINYQIPISLQIHLLRVLVNFEFSGFHQWEPRRDAEEYEDVYIGSYGKESVARITPRLREILSKPNPGNALEAYYRAHNSAEPY